MIPNVFSSRFTYFVLLQFLLFNDLVNGLGNKYKKLTENSCTSEPQESPGSTITTKEICLLAAQNVDPVLIDGVIEAKEFTDDAKPKGCLLKPDDNTNKLMFNVRTTNDIKVCTNDYPCICSIKCPTGKYQDEESQTVCKLCLAGLYTNEIGQSECKQCNKGDYQNEVGTFICKNCDQGKFNIYIYYTSSL
jgi:hypothetical protein